MCVCESSQSTLHTSLATATALHRLRYAGAEWRPTFARWLSQSRWSRPWRTHRPVPVCLHLNELPKWNGSCGALGDPPLGVSPRNCLHTPSTTYGLYTYRAIWSVLQSLSFHPPTWESGPGLSVPSSVARLPVSSVCVDSLTVDCRRVPVAAPQSVLPGPLCCHSLDQPGHSRATLSTPTTDWNPYPTHSTRYKRQFLLFPCLVPPRPSILTCLPTYSPPPFPSPNPNTTYSLCFCIHQPKEKEQSHLLLFRFSFPFYQLSSSLRYPLFFSF